MSLKAGRVGVNPNQVDPVDGSIKSSATEGYTKQEADVKFETKTNASNTYQKKTLELPLETLIGSKLTIEDSLDALNEIQKTRQPKTLAVPIEMLDGSKLTVESALQGLNSEKVTKPEVLFGVEITDVSMDDIKSYGRYRLNGNIRKAPGFNYGIVDVLVHNANNITQLAYGNGLDQTSKIVKRKFIDGTWTSWYVFTGTELT